MEPRETTNESLYGKRAGCRRHSNCLGGIFEGNRGTCGAIPAKVEVYRISPVTGQGFEGLASAIFLTSRWIESSTRKTPITATDASPAPNAINPWYRFNCFSSSVC